MGKRESSFSVIFRILHSSTLFIGWARSLQKDFSYCTNSIWIMRYLQFLLHINSRKICPNLITYDLSAETSFQTVPCNSFAYICQYNQPVFPIGMFSPQNTKFIDRYIMSFVSIPVADSPCLAIFLLVWLLRGVGFSKRRKGPQGERQLN